VCTTIDCRGSDGGRRVRKREERSERERERGGKEEEEKEEEEEMLGRLKGGGRGEKSIRADRL
jgi:hypothetical protein